MTPVFDPRNWRGDQLPWVDRWVDLTRSWLQPGARLGIEPECILADLVDGVVQRFGGRPVEITVRGRLVRAQLDSLRLRRRPERCEVRMELSDVGFDGFRFEQVSAEVSSVGIEPERQPRLVASKIGVTGRSALAPIVAWLASQVPDWTLTVDDTGRIAGHHIARPITVEVEPWVDHDLLHIQLSQLRWHGRRLPVPRRLLRRNPVALSPLASGVSVVAARRRGPTVDFELQIAAIRQEIELAHLREAILRDARMTLP